jgi:hypothetical protein
MTNEKCQNVFSAAAPIREKVEAGERLSFDDGLTRRTARRALPELGELANLVRERKNGNAAYFNINTHLNPTKRLRLSLHVLRVPLDTCGIRRDTR